MAARDVREAEKLTRNGRDLEVMELEIDHDGSPVTLEAAAWYVCFVPGLKKQWWHSFVHERTCSQRKYFADRVQRALERRRNAVNALCTGPRSSANETTTMGDLSMDGSGGPRILR